jgi:glucose uptake protein GlcU
MISSFIDLQTFALFMMMSILFMIASFRFNFKAMQNQPGKLATIFLVAGIIVGFSDMIVFLQDKDASAMVSGEEFSITKQIGVILLAPFYGVIFSAVTWFAGSGQDSSSSK